jgi:hypothetical protein
LSILLPLAALFGVLGDTPELEVFVVEAFEMCLDGFGREFGGGVCEQLGDRGVAAHGFGDDAVAAAGERFEAGRDVDVRAEVVEPLVERDGDAGAGVNAGLEL